MRRSDKEITDSREIAAIMEKAAVCRIALVDDDFPYIVPVNFVVRNNYLYFHSAGTGRKIDILRKITGCVLKLISRQKQLREMCPVPGVPDI
jgi:uncharacterized protein